MVIACSCPEEHLEKDQNEWIFTATVGEIQTKTAFQADETSIWWSPGDAIAIYYGGSPMSLFTSTNTVEVPQAEFRGKMNVFTGETESGSFNYFWAIYPYSSAYGCDGQSILAHLSDEQEAKSGSFAPNTNVTIAKSSGLALSFYNVCSWFRFSVTKEGVNRVEFRGNNNEDIAGWFYVSMDDNNRPTVTETSYGVKLISLSPPGGASFEVGKIYYIAMLPQVFQNGFTVTFKTDSEAGSRSINSKATFIRSKYNTGYEFDKDIAYAPRAKVGDIIDSNGVGVVCWISDDEMQLLLMSVTELRNEDWPTSNNWCTSYGESWRMPTLDELTMIHTNFSAINASLSKAKYTQLTNEDYGYWSSTPTPHNKKYYCRERLSDGTILSTGTNVNPSSTANYTRAVKMIYK